MDCNKAALERINPDYKKMLEERKDEFTQNILDADYQLSILNSIESLNPTFSLSVRQNLNYVQSYCKNVVAGPDFYTKRKNLKSYTLIYTISGQGELIWQGKKHCMDPGDCCLLDCRPEHSYRTLSSGGWELTQVHFYGDKLSYLYGIWESYHHPVVSVKGHPTFKSSLDELGEHCRAYSISHALAMDCNISYLLSVLVNAAVFQNESGYPRKIKKVCQYIDSHYAEQLTLERIANENLISKYYLSREFKKYTGQTLMDYLRGVRLTQSKTLLLSTDLPIAEVAQLVGFEYANYFQNVFKKYEGITPLHFRKQWMA